MRAKPKAVSAYLTSKQILPSGFAEQCYKILWWQGSNYSTAVQSQRQYVLTLQVSRYCLSALWSNATMSCAGMAAATAEGRDVVPEGSHLAHSSWPESIRQAGAAISRLTERSRAASLWSPGDFSFKPPFNETSHGNNLFMILLFRWKCCLHSSKQGLRWVLIDRFNRWVNYFTWCR